MTTDALAPLKGATVWVTGAHGFLGRVVVWRLEEAGATVLGPTHAELELRDPSATSAFAREHRPNVVVHLAARVGGIGANQRHPGTFWRDNTLMGVNVLEAAREAASQRAVIVGTVCAYPKFTPVPFLESSLWEGFPEETNAPYGVAKRALATGLDAYSREFGLGGSYLLPANLYGPHDDFHLENSHVIPAIIRKCVDAKRAEDEAIDLWGTGSASREFLYVEDCAEAVVLAAARGDDPAPMNLGTGREITIRELAELIVKLTGFGGAIRWDASRPDGQPRRALDTSVASERLGWSAGTSLEQGLAATIAWFEANRDDARLG